MRKFFLQLLFWGSAIPAIAQHRLAPLPATSDRLVLIAHRGNHTRVPENTLAAIEQAIQCGVDYVEIDLRTTSDGFLVLSHDGSVNRTTDGKGNIKDLTLEEIQNLRISASDAADKHIYRIPQFREVLALCRNKMNIYLDFKDADVQETLGQIKAAGMEKRVVVYLNKPEQYQQWRKAAPRMPLMSSIPDEVVTAEQFDAFFERTPLEVVDNISDKSLLSILRKKGVAVWLDVESRDEDPRAWNDAIKKGVQGLQTDHPEALVDYLYENKLRKRPAPHK